MNKAIEKDLCNLFQSSFISCPNNKRIKVVHGGHLPNSVSEKEVQHNKDSGDENDDPLKHKNSMSRCKVQGMRKKEDIDEERSDCVNSNRSRDCGAQEDDHNDFDDYITRVREHVGYLNTKDEGKSLLFYVRAKLFEFVKGRDKDFENFASHLYSCNQKDGPNRWTLRGIGDVKFMRYMMKDDITYGTVRMQLEHEGTRKCLMNQLVESYMEVRL